MAFRTPQTGREMPSTYGDGVEDKYIYTVFRSCAKDAAGRLSKLDGYDPSKTPYAWVTSFLDNSRHSMSYQLFYLCKPLLREFRLHIKAKRECAYNEQIESEMSEHITHILEVEVPDFSRVHDHPYRSRIRDDPCFFAAICDVVSMGCSMVVDPTVVHVVVVQTGGIEKRNEVFHGINPTHASALHAYGEFYRPIIDTYYIFVKKLCYQDRFIVLHKNCAAILRITQEMFESSSSSSSEEDY